MSNSTSLLDLMSSTQANKEAVANALFDAASPATLWGRRSSTTSGLTWGYYGGQYYTSSGAQTIASGTLTLTASATNYVYANSTTGAVSVNTTGFPTGSIPLYTIVAGTTTVTSYTDQRSYQPSASAATAGAPSMNLAGGAVQTAAYTWATTDKGQALVMNASSAVSQPLPAPSGTTGSFPAGWWGGVQNIGAGVMTLTVPSGVSLDGVANGTLVLDQGTGVLFFTDGTNLFTIRGAASGGGGGSTTLAGLSDVNVTEGAAIDGFSLVYDQATGKWIADLVSGGTGQIKPQFHGAQISTVGGTAQAITANTTAYLDWTTENYDLDGWFSSANPTRLTVPAGLGFKKVSLFAQALVDGIASATSGQQMWIRKNGTTIVGVGGFVPGFTGSGNFVHAFAGGVVVSDGDYFEVAYYTTSSGVTIEAAAPCQFTVIVDDLGPQTYAPPATANMDLVSYFIGTIGASQVLMNAVTPQALTLPASLAGSYAYCDTAPTAAVSCPINLISGGTTTAIGSINFAAGATSGTFTFSSAVTTTPGDTIQITAPASADATFAGPRFGLAGTTAVSAGGVNEQTSAYTPAPSDRSGLIVMNSASATSNALPAATGSTGNYPNGWRTEFLNIGTGTATLTVPSGASLNGTVNGTLARTTGQGCKVWTDGNNWFAY